ncbi:MAG TPA: hypothetical protein VFA59_06990 [Vicinamibacterales bacterium]|nr:hypothetical protein [Vicinamibacterales bacterium]
MTVATVISAASFRPLAVSTATGSVHITGGNTTAVSGTYDSSTNGVSVSGGGFSFTGTVNGGALSGSYSQNDVTGGFSALNTSAGSVTTYCGTYNSVKPFKDNFGRSGTYFENGNWNVQVSSNGVATGESIPTSSGYSGPAQGPKPPAAPNFLTGQLVGNALTLTAEGGTLTVNVNLQAGIMSGGVESTGALSVSASAAACQ